MSEEQLVDAYLRGEVSRRTFIRRLVAAGLTLSAAVAYTHALKPGTAEADDAPGHPFYDDPSFVTGEAFLSGTSATLTGTLRPNGKATDWWFEFGTTAAFGTRTPQPPRRVSARIESESAFARIDGLQRGQLYHYRLVGENVFGRSLGQDRTFRIPAVQQAGQGTPPPPPPTYATRPLVTIGAVSIPLEQLLRARKVQLMVGADEACTMLMELFYDPPAASQRRRRRRKIRVGAKRVRFSKPGAKNVKIKLSRKGRKALKGKNRAALRLVTTTRDAAGNKVKKRRRLRFS